MKHTETPELLGVFQSSRLGKTLDAIRGQRWSPIGRQESKPQAGYRLWVFDA
jgi:hypothetical protein